MARHNWFDIKNKYFLKILFLWLKPVIFNIEITCLIQCVLPPFKHSHQGILGAMILSKTGQYIWEFWFNLVVHDLTYEMKTMADL